MGIVREVVADGWRVRLDLERQVLRLDMPEWDEEEDELLPTLPLDSEGPISVAALLLKSKQFDDGLYAAVELAAQVGIGPFRGKAELLRELAETLVGTGSGGAAAHLLAAATLGDTPLPIPAALQADVDVAIGAFLSDPWRSKPLGFYSWSPRLQAIFRQDRFLQDVLDTPRADAIAAALRQAPGAEAAYDACLALAARLTNRLDSNDVREGDERVFFPPSRSHEVDIFRRMYADRPIPDGFDLMGELIRRVRSGDYSLQPSEVSGWYDHQTWSLEPLIVPDRRPESSRMQLGKGYRKHLEDVFRGSMALTRETHAKGGGGGRGGYGGPVVRPIWIGPDLAVEPLPSVYARRAAAYTFVRSVLESTFGEASVASLHRLTPHGPRGPNLNEELHEMEALFAGASAAAWHDLGSESPAGAANAKPRFDAWRATAGNDVDLARDARMMVPVFYDVQRRKMKVWAFLGWKTTTVHVSFQAEPKVLSIESETPGRKAPSPPVKFTQVTYELATPVMAEVYVTRLLDRAEFRRHCDRYRQRRAILRTL